MTLIILYIAMAARTDIDKQVPGKAGWMEVGRPKSSTRTTEQMMHNHFEQSSLIRSKDCTGFSIDI